MCTLFSCGRFWFHSCHTIVDNIITCLMKLMTLSLGYCRAIDNCCLFVLFVCFLVLLIFFPLFWNTGVIWNFYIWPNTILKLRGWFFMVTVLKWMLFIHSTACLCLLFRNSLFRNSSVCNTMYSGKEEAYDDNFYRNNINISCSSKHIIFKSTTSTKHLFFWCEVILQVDYLKDGIANSKSID